MSVWDDPELQQSGEFVKFENPGDSISGTITAVRKHRFEDGNVVPQINIKDDNGEDRTLTAGQIRLRTLLAEQRPEVGDHITVVYERSEKRAGGKTLKHFTVTVKRGAGEKPVPF